MPSIPSETSLRLLAAGLGALSPCLSVGCGCPDLADIEITDPDGVATEGMVEELSQAVEDFAAWTGRDAVCVGELRIQEDVAWHGGDSSPSGRLQPGRKRISIEASGENLREIAFHELCHALDHEEQLAWPNRASLDTSLVPSGSCTDDRCLVEEAFATACEAGPQQAWPLAAVVEDSCGGPAIQPIWRMLYEEVWVGFPYQPSPTERVPIDVDRVELGGTLPPIGASTTLLGSGGDDLFVLEGGVQSVTLSRVDPERGVVRASFSLGASELEDWAIISGVGDSGPLLLNRWSSHTNAYRYDLATDSLVRVSFPLVESTTMLRGRAQRDRAWVWARLNTLDDSPSSDAFVEVDLGTAEWWTMPVEVGALSPVHFVPGGAGIVGTGRDGGGDITLFELDVETPGIRRWPYPAWMSPSWVPMLPTPEGELVGWQEIGETGVETLTRFDPTTETWAIGADPCAAEGLHSSDQAEVLGGEPWFVAWEGTDSAKTWSLVHLTTEEGD